MNKLYIILIAITWGLAPGYCFSQNLVPNPSFEIFTSCPTSIGGVNLLYNWHNPTLTTPDLFSKCAPNTNLQVPSNYAGYEDARTDSSYIGIVLLKSDTTLYREYISVQLLDTLDADSIYCISFFVSCPDSIFFYTDNISVHFSMNQINQGNINYLNLTSHFKNQELNYFDRKDGWMNISGHYVASGGESYITIGNFDHNLNTNSYGDNSFNAFVYLDDVSLIKCSPSDTIEPPDTTSPPEPPVTTLSVSINPNPFSEYFIVETELLDGMTGSIELFDAVGRKVDEITLSEGRSQTSHYPANWASGIYSWRLLVNGDPSVFGGKLIKVK